MNTHHPGKWSTLVAGVEPIHWLWGFLIPHSTFLAWSFLFRVQHSCLDHSYSAFNILVLIILIPRSTFLSWSFLFRVQHSCLDHSYSAFNILVLIILIPRSTFLSWSFLFRVQHSWLDHSYSAFNSLVLIILIPCSTFLAWSFSSIHCVEPSPLSACSNAVTVHTGLIVDDRFNTILHDFQVTRETIPDTWAGAAVQLASIDLIHSMEWIPLLFLTDLRLICWKRSEKNSLRIDGEEKKEDKLWWRLRMRFSCGDLHPPFWFYVEYTGGVFHSDIHDHFYFIVTCIKVSVSHSQGSG